MSEWDDLEDFIVRPDPDETPDRWKSQRYAALRKANKSVGRKWGSTRPRKTAATNTAKAGNEGEG